MGNSKIPKMADKSNHTERRETLSGTVWIPDHPTEPRLARMLGKTHEVSGIQGPTRIPEGTVLINVLTEHNAFNDKLCSDKCGKVCYINHCKCV